MSDSPKFCPICGETSRPDARQCVCGHLFFGTPRPTQQATPTPGVTGETPTVFRPPVPASPLPPAPPPVSRVEDAIRLQHELQYDIAHAQPMATEHSRTSGALGGGCIGVMLGFMTFGMGLFLLLIPVIGWVMGPALMLGAFFVPVLCAGAGALGKVFSGICPYCGHSVSGTAPGFNCNACQNRIVIRDGRFYAVNQLPPPR